MNTWKVILATLAIFGTGVLTGGLLVDYSHRPRSDSPRRPFIDGSRPPMERGPGFARENRLPPPMPVPLRREFLERLDRELNLTPAQFERIEKIITEGQDQTRKVWQQVEPQMRREFTATRERIRAELTTDQQARFEELLRQRHRDARDPRDPRRPLQPGERPPPNRSPSAQTNP